MSYSGTVGNTVISVQTLIDHGARRAGKLAEELTDEQVQSAKESLFYILSNLINQGIQYWAVNKLVMGLNADQYIYSLPNGANDILNCLYRTMNQPSGSYTTSAGGTVANVYDNNITTYCQQTSANGNISVFYGTGQNNYIGSIGFMPYISGGGSQTWNYTFQGSADGTTWTTLYTGTSVTVTDSQWIWQDIDPGLNVPYYRMVATGGTTLSLRELYFGNNARLLQMSRLNRDDYTNLPNQNFTANQPYQYWFDRTIPQPTFYLWPVPSTYFVQATIWYSRQIQDVGALTNQLEIPDRWMLAVQSMLAHQMSIELPGVEIPRIQYLEGQAEKYFQMAELEERDRSPIYFSPNIIAVYEVIYANVLGYRRLCKHCDCRVRQVQDEACLLNFDPDINFPGLRVCDEGCMDEKDPYRLPARKTERINLRFPRPDLALDVPNNQLITGQYSNSIISTGTNTSAPNLVNGDEDEIVIGS